MRRGRTKLPPSKHKPLRMGPPRVVEDVELYHIIAGVAAEGCAVKLIDEEVRSWCKPWEDWQLGIVALRAQLFLGCIRKELGRRSDLDPNQLRLQKGI